MTMGRQRKKVLTILKDDPVRVGRALGFNKLTDLHNQWLIDMVYGHGDKTLQAHRGSYKTTDVSVALFLIMILFPNDRTLFMRKTDTDVKEVIAQVQKMLGTEFAHWLVHEVWGVNLEVVKFTQTEITTNLTNDPRGSSQLTAQGLNGSLTGKHYDRIFTDDIVNIQDRASKAERDHTKLVYQELQNIKNRGGRIYNTGTPWHKEDAFTIMPNPVKYDCYSTGLITPQELQSIRDKMSPSLFAANYELRHIASEDVIFQPLDASHFGLSPSLVEQGLMHVDSGFYGEDYTAMTVGKKHDGKYYVLLKMWRKHVEDCYPDIINAYRRFMAGKCYMETNADKGMVARDLRQAGMKMVTYAESMNKYVKIVTYLKSIWSDVYFVEGTDMDAVQQIYDYNDEAEHDDAPDSLASMARILYNKRETGGSAAYSMFL